jgi:thymidylate synthase ThyX
MKTVPQSFEVIQKDELYAACRIICDNIVKEAFREYFRIVQIASDPLKETQITVITPETMVENSLQELIYNEACIEAETRYFSLLGAGVPRNIAKKVLPLGIKEEFEVGGHIYHWNEFFKSKCPEYVYPEIRVLASN